MKYGELRDHGYHQCKQVDHKVIEPVLSVEASKDEPTRVLNMTRLKSAYSPMLHNSTHIAHMDIVLLTHS